MFSGFLFLSILIVLEIQATLEQRCKSVQPVLDSETGHALIGVEYTSFHTEHHALCLLECEKSERCMSLNYYQRTSVCYLNTQTKESRPERYEPRRDCIYFKNPSGRIPAKFRGMKALPAKSCLDVLVSGGSIGTGVYWLDPESTGNPFKAYCDMETDGGGWTIVKKTVLHTNSESIPAKKFYDYYVIKEYDRKDVDVLPTTDAMSSINQLLGFHQIHFFCYKKSVGRKVSIMTKNDTAGQQVVRYFTKSGFNFPNACGSYEALPEDTSILAQNCEKWGRNDNGSIGIDKWGSWNFRGDKKLVSRPFAMEGENKHIFGMYYYQSGFYYKCDDAARLYEPGDVFQISVR